MVSTSDLCDMEGRWFWQSLEEEDDPGGCSDPTGARKNVRHVVTISEAHKATVGNKFLITNDESCIKCDW
jgi:hypothetical protein